MNKGTILRTLAFLVTTANNGIAQLGDVDFGNEKLNTIYKVFAFILNGIAGIIALYYNNDFSEEGCLGTAYTRYLKSIKNSEYVGEDFTQEGDKDE